jgi:inosose dehydratase
MRSLGLTATELGAPGFLPEDATPLQAALDRYGMTLVGGFVPLVLHDRDQRQDALQRAEQTAALFEACGATRFVTAVVQDYDWSSPVRLDAEGMKVLGEGLEQVGDVCVSHGLVQVLHPHVGTLVETAADVELALRHTSVLWCLDTGHLQIGGVDPVTFARDVGDRVAHVHLKDVDLSIAPRVVSRELSLVQGVQQGLFQPLGGGDVAVDEVVLALEELGYDGWYVLEQDTALTQGVPAEGSGPVEDVQKSLAFLLSEVVPRVSSAPIV